MNRKYFPLPVRSEPVDGHEVTMTVVRQAHHERNQKITTRPELVEGHGVTMTVVRQAHHERNQKITVRPELVEGLVQNLLGVFAARNAT